MRFVGQMKSANILRIVQLVVSMCLIAHWTVCFWHFLRQQFPDRVWMFDAVESENIDMGIYVYGYYSSLTLMVHSTHTQRQVSKQ